MEQGHRDTVLAMIQLLTPAVFANFSDEDQIPPLSSHNSDITYDCRNNAAGSEFFKPFGAAAKVRAKVESAAAKQALAESAAVAAITLAGTSANFASTTISASNHHHSSISSK